MPQIHIQCLFILVLSIFLVMKLKQASQYGYVESHCELASYSTPLRQSNVIDCATCINLDVNRQVKAEIQINTLNQEINQIWFGIWEQKQCYDYECKDLFFPNDFFGFQEDNKAELEKLTWKFKGKGTTTGKIGYMSSLEDDDDGIGIDFLKLLAPVFQYFNVFNYQYTSSVLLRYRYNYIGSEDDVLKPQVKVFQKSQSMEDAIFLSTLVSFAVLLSNKSLYKAALILFSFLSPILASFMSLFYLSTKSQIYSLSLLAYAVGLGTSNTIISALVLIIFFIREVYKSNKITQNIAWVVMFLILSSSYWLNIDSLVTFTPILLYGFIQLESGNEYQEISVSRDSDIDEKEELK